MSAPAPLNTPFVLPPGQDDLPWDDGEPMESERHRDQMTLLIESLRLSLPGRLDIYIGGNMGLYYTTLQALKNECRAPDFFVVLNAVIDRHRKSWVVWEEDSRTPDVIIELLSSSTESVDRGRKMQIYAGLKVWEYYLFDPEDLRLERYHLRHGAYVRTAARPDGDFECPILGLRLGLREGCYHESQGQWLRWIRPDGMVLPTGEEMAAIERSSANEEHSRAEEEHSRAEAALARTARLLEQLRKLGVDPEAK